MVAIVCVDQNWGIGKDGRLLFHISADLKRFRALTTGKTVILGRKTLATFPGGKPLPNRTNLVLTHGADAIEGATLAASPAQAAALASEDAVVIGGSSVYAEFLPYCDRVFVTQVDVSAQADAFFPNLDTNPDWYAETVGDWQDENGLRFRYADYVRK